jgi:hypothetical protein
MKCPEPSVGTVADYCAERLASGLLDEPIGLDLPKALIPCFIGLSDELYRATKSGTVKRWLDRSTIHGFSEAFVKALVAFMDSCLHEYREDAA